MFVMLASTTGCCHSSVILSLLPSTESLCFCLCCPLFCHCCFLQKNVSSLCFQSFSLMCSSFRHQLGILWKTHQTFRVSVTEWIQHHFNWPAGCARSAWTSPTLSLLSFEPESRCFPAPYRRGFCHLFSVCSCRCDQRWLNCCISRPGQCCKWDF